MRLIVGPEGRLRPTLPEGVRLLVLRSPQAAAPTLAGDDLFLELRFNDIDSPRTGLVAPTLQMIARLLSFGRHAEQLGIACYAGVSRSTAAAYALACQAAGPGAEETLAQTLRKLSPAATPNPLMVALADQALGRDGRMIHAIAAIGRGAEAFEGPLFHWTLPQREIDRSPGAA